MSKLWQPNFASLFWSSLLLFLRSPEPTRGQQQFLFRPSDQQWYFSQPGQQPQPLQQQQIQLNLAQLQQLQQQQQQNVAQQQQQQFQSPSQFQFQQTIPPVQQQPQQQQQSFFFHPGQPQQQQQQQQFPQPPQQQQQQQFGSPFPSGGQFNQSPQQQQPQFQQFPGQQQPQFFQFQQPQQQQQADQFQQQFGPIQQQNWFVPSFGPGEFQEQLPELIRPPLLGHIVQREPQPQQQQQQDSPPPPPPPPLFLQQHHQQQFFPQQQPNAPPQPPQQQIAPPVPPPRIVHIQAQEFQELLPKLLQMPVLSEQVTPARSATRRPPPLVTRRPASRRPAPTRAAAATTPQPKLHLVKEEKEPLEFDLPPPPPARFLPESEKIRIAEFLRQQQKLKHQQSVHAGLVTDFPTLVLSSTMPPRRSTLARLAAVPEQPVVGGEGQKVDPNRVFLDCCKRKRVARQCESRCNFDTLSKKILTGLFLGSDKCPTEHGLDLFTCAAQDSDHSSCCRQSRVDKTSAGDKCLAFCNLAPEAPRIQLDAGYLPCWAVLNEVKQCFREKIVESG